MAPLQRSQQAPLCLMTRAQSLESTGHFSLLHVTSLFWKKKIKRQQLLQANQTEG